MSEVLDVWSADGATHLGVKDRDAVHRDGDWHRSLHLWVRDEDGALVLQRRSARKAAWPGMLDATAAGHLTAGESVLDGLREAEEELGIAFAPEDVDAWRTISMEDHGGPGRPMVNREHQHVFLAREPVALTAFTAFDRGEVDGLVAVAVDGVAALLAGEPARGRAWDGERTAGVVVEPAELLLARYLGDLVAHLRCA